jgi:hypothetical protein
MQSSHQNINIDERIIIDADNGISYITIIITIAMDDDDDVDDDISQSIALVCRSR